MKLLYTLLGLYASINTATADFHSARSLEVGNNVELGKLSGLHEFHGILRRDLGILHRDLDHSFEYEDVTVYESVDSDAFPRSPKRDTSDTSAPGGNFSIQANECTDMTSWERMLCENMPSWHWFWGAGGVLAFYYSPSLLANFVNVSVEHSLLPSPTSPTSSRRLHLTL